MQLKGENTSAYIIIAYQYVKSTSAVGTIFMQRERYLKRCNISRCSRQHFIQDLVSFITSLLDGNNKIILTANINEHVIDRKLSRELKSFGMIDTYVKKFNLLRLVYHIMDSELIDRV